MNTRQYYYLTTIDACGNLSRAAQALGVSPSALSKFLAECERSFGFALFLRYGRRLYPTAVGRFAVECAQKILDEQRRMLLTMKAVMGRSRRQIRLATAPNRGAIIYSKIYRPFSRRYPDVALSLTELLAIESTWLWGRAPPAPAPPTSRWPMKSCWSPCRRPTRWQGRQPSVWTACGTPPSCCRGGGTASEFWPSSCSGRQALRR